MSTENILVNWSDFATVKRWKSQFQKKNDDKIIPTKTKKAMSTWMPQLLKFHNKTPDELIEEAISDPEMGEKRLDDFYRYKKRIN